jgi:hypothetical protein
VATLGCHFRRHTISESTCAFSEAPPVSGACGAIGAGIYVRDRWGTGPIRTFGLRGASPSELLRLSVSAAYRLESQQDVQDYFNPLIAIQLQCSAGCVAPFPVTKIDFDVIADIAAKRKIHSKP